ncbi:hypothetical protein [Dysgonomonas sp. 511]|uniref:hypothetical protein n=1 Tax=Dysgonomonas sp. 511 TaxID=2302930 RepID=UPI0013D8A583|nr:hypothetical protein [Dysgonomonas sp. 511]NDV79788.1 hypothetical protein [Dysgonomonas sp. 511]
MIPLNKIANARAFSNAKLIVLSLLFLGALAYGLLSLNGIVYNSTYSRTLMFESLKLDPSKEYFFVREYETPASPNSMMIPMGRVNMPDSLCTLYYDKEQKEWKLWLTPDLRTSHIDKDEKTILYPFCRLNERKRSYVEEDFFHPTTKTPTQKDLLTGIRFNNASGQDAFVLQIKEKEGEYYLAKGFAFLPRRKVPILRNNKNVTELDFCINGDTVGDIKYIFSFPLPGFDSQPERRKIIVEGDSLNYNGYYEAIEKDNLSFIVNDCVFVLKNNYTSFSKYIILPLLFLMIVCFGSSMLWRLYILTNRSQGLRQRNLIIVEQFNVLGLRVLFNCIILLGFPILLIKIQGDESRLYTIVLFALALNLNWISITRWFAQRLRSDSKKIRIASIIIVIVMIVVSCFTTNELVLGEVPVLKVATIVFVFLPFAMGYFFNLKLSILEKLTKKVVNNEEDTDRNARNESGRKFVFNLTCYFVLLIIIIPLIAYLSSDSATLIFTFLSLLLLLTINFKRLLILIKTSTVKVKCYFVLLLVVGVVALCSYTFYDIDEKRYRALSTFFFPDNENMFGEYPNIEGSRETIAGQLFLLNSVGHNFEFNFNTIILPEYKTTFFSDYAVLWSFKIGGWIWFILYLGVLIMLSYTILSLLVIFSKPIRLKTGKKSCYNTKVIFGLNLLLAIMLVQYIYTFLTNFWVIPLTGQSPGIFSPSRYEYIFHIVVINYIYVYLLSSVEDRKVAIRQAKAISKNIPSYISTKSKSLFIPVLIALCSVCWLFVQRNRMNGYIEEKGGKMGWQIMQESKFSFLSKLSKDSLLVLAHGSFEKMDNDRVERRKFRDYLRAYYRSHDAKRTHNIGAEYIKRNTNIDSLTSVRKKVLGKDASSWAYFKYVNGRETTFINDKYQGGCPPSAETVDFDLQCNLNKALENWAKKINSKYGYEMIGGSILIAENQKGYILASASYPFMYNENLYHVLFENEKMNTAMQGRGVDVDRIVVRYDNPDYLNFAENDILPGSIVKPLLAYCGLSIFPANYSEEYLFDFLCWSRNDKAEKIYTDLFVRGNNSATAHAILKSDFGFTPYTEKRTELKDAPAVTHAIGQYSKQSFKNVVQAYIRIKTGRKTGLSYQKTDASDEVLSLDEKQLKILRKSMCALDKGTAVMVGNTLRRKKITTKHFIAKTGTAQIGKNKEKNRSSSIIIVGEKITIGIQLYGILPSSKNGLSAQHLCNYLVSNGVVELQ